MGKNLKENSGGQLPMRTARLGERGCQEPTHPPCGSVTTSSSQKDLEGQRGEATS